MICKCFTDILTAFCLQTEGVGGTIQEGEGGGRPTVWTAEEGEQCMLGVNNRS